MKIQSNRNFRISLYDKSIYYPTFAEHLINDKDLWLAFKANIAMKFVDNYHRFKKNKKSSLNNKEIHQVANDAAEEFLQLWTGQR